MPVRITGKQQRYKKAVSGDTATKDQLFQNLISVLYVHIGEPAYWLLNSWYCFILL